MSTIRYSKQREAIKDYLKSVTCHPTADTVYLNIQKTFPNNNHFFCRACKCLLDIKMDSIEHIDIIANANFPGKIEGHTVIFHGLCEKCCQKAPC